MNDRARLMLSVEEVEDRLRRTFAARAEDMASGDGARSGDVDRAGADEGAVVHVLAPSEAPRAGASEPAVRRRRRRVLAVAAAMLVACGVAATALTWAGGTDGGRDSTDSTNSPDRDPGRVVDRPAPHPTTSTTLAPGSRYQVGDFARGEDDTLTASFEATAVDVTSLDVAGLLGDEWRPVQAGPNRGYVAAPPGDTSEQLWLLFADGIVRMQGDSLAREELIAAAATVRKDPSTGRYAMPTPEGWTEVSDDPTVTGPGRHFDGVQIGHFTDGNGAFYGVVWYPDWTADDVPADTERLEVADGPAFLGSVAPDNADLLQLWIAYDDGVVELQSTRMARDELIAAGNGVARRPGTDDFDLTPPPGFATTSAPS